MLPRKSEFVAGWIDTTIHEFLATIEEPSSSMSYALITCLDSSFDAPSLLETSPSLRELKEKCTIVGNGLLLTTRQLLAAERRARIFFGFDELWFFDRREITPKPEEVVFVGPEKILEETLERTSQWMQATGCSLGLGDGAGMNFCARLRGVARHLVEAFGNSPSAESENQPAAVRQPI
jgi:hypothetical protein